MNVSREGCLGDERALGIELGGVAVGHLADGGGRGHEAHLDPLEPGQRQLQEVGVLGEVAHERPLAGVAEAGHAVLHVGDEALPRLLAVVADVDAGLDLLGDDGRGGLLDRALRSSSGSTSSPRLRRPCISASAGRAREAAGVGGEEPRLARQHAGSLTYRSGMSDVRPAGPKTATWWRASPPRGSSPTPCSGGCSATRPAARAARGALRRAVRRHGARTAAPSTCSMRPAPPCGGVPTSTRRDRPATASQDAPRRGRAHHVLRRGDRAAHHPRRRHGRGAPARAALVPQRGEHAPEPPEPGPRRRPCSRRCSTTPTTTAGPATSSRATRGTSASTCATASWRPASCRCPTGPSLVQMWREPRD